MIESCWSCDDFHNVKNIFKLSLSNYTFAPKIFKICMEKMSNEKEKLCQAVSMISKIIRQISLDDQKFKNVLVMLSGINTSLFGRSEEKV